MTVIQLFNGSRFIGKGRGNGVVRVCDTFGIDWEQKRGNKTCKITRVVLVVLEKRDFVFFFFILDEELACTKRPWPTLWGGERVNSYHESVHRGKGSWPFFPPVRVVWNSLFGW